MAIELGSLAGLRVGLAFIASLAALLGFGVGYGGWCRTRAWRGWTLAGAALAFGVFALAYWSALAGFCRLERRGDRLQVVRALPCTSEELALARVTAVERTAGVRPFLARLCLRLDDGRTLESQSAPFAVVDEARRALDGWLAPERR